jgi:hypothetical protein
MCQPEQAFSTGATKAKVVINRTGAATVVGGIYQRDIAQTDGDSGTTVADAGKAIDNIIAVATARRMYPVCVALDAVADNKPLRVIETYDEPVICKIRVLGASGTVKGDVLKTVNAQNYMSKATYTTNAANAILLETWETTSVALKTVAFFSMAQPPMT